MDIHFHKNIFVGIVMVGHMCQNHNFWGIGTVLYIYLNHKSLIDSIYLTLKEPSQEIKLKLGLNGAEVQ